MSNEEIIETIKALVKSDVGILNAKEIMDIFHINRNKATEFLKKYGVKVGCYCIEKEKLLEILRNEEGDLL